MRQRLYGCLLLGAALLGFWWGVLPSAPAARSAAPTSDSDSFPSRGLHWQGVGSCSAAACHGGNGPPGTKGSEYTTWVNRDPHARAFAVLYGERSERIIKNLNGPKAAPASNDRLCLSCHAMNVPQSLQSPRLALEDGVGCESCHGPAEKWLARHYRPRWKQLRSETKAKWGMRPTKDLAARAKLCVECHVGSRDKDVNHDLIAAGHPRLNFDFGSYLAILPKHWSMRDEKARYPDFEARAWAIGQVAAAQQALELLAYRADKPDKPWPEFAEYNCFSCHHDLREPSRWRKENARKPPGALTWGSWYFSDMPPRALDYQAAKGASMDWDALTRLRAEMQKPFPNRDEVARHVKAVSRQLKPWLMKLDGASCKGPGFLRKQMLTFTDDGQNLDMGDWDEATQRYLALAAFYNGLGDLHPKGQDPHLKRILKNMAENLQFKEYDSPYYFDPEVVP